MQIQLQTDWNKYVSNICFRERGVLEREREGLRCLVCEDYIAGSLSLSENRSWRFSFFFLLMFCFSFLNFCKYQFHLWKWFYNNKQGFRRKLCFKIFKTKLFGFIYIGNVCWSSIFHSFLLWLLEEVLYMFFFFLVSACIWIFDQNQTNWSETVY